MNNVTRYDGGDAIVLDPHGRCVRAVDEVRLDPDRAVVALKQAPQNAWTAAECARLAELAALGPFCARRHGALAGARAHRMRLSSITATHDRIACHVARADEHESGAQVPSSAWH
jgi:hypothetical protein